MNEGTCLYQFGSKRERERERKKEREPSTKCEALEHLAKTETAMFVHTWIVSLRVCMYVPKSRNVLTHTAFYYDWASLIAGAIKTTNVFLYVSGGRVQNMGRVKHLQ